KEGIKGKRTAKEFCTALYAFIKDTQLDEKIQHRSEQLLLEGKSDLAAKDVSVYNCIISSMDSLISCCQDLKRGPKKYAEALSEGLNSIKSAIIPSAVDCVNTGNAPRTKGSDSKVVFLVGVNDGIFPAVSSSGGILTDSDRRMLHDASIELAPDSQGFNFEEQALVYSTLTLAKDKLYVSYSLADTDGTTLRPSVIIRMLKEIFPDIKTLSDVVPRKAYELISAPEGTFDHMICALRRIYDGQLEDSDWLKVYGWFTENKNDEFQAENAVKAFNRKNFAKSLSEDTVKEFFNQNMKTSVSRLETYKSCPFRYYMNYMIMAKPRKVALVSPADAGSLLHYYIESFSSKLKLSCMSWNDVTEEYINQEAASITDEVISKSQSLMLKDSKRASYQIVRLQRLASKSLALIRRHIVQGSFEPLGYEISFEDGGDFLPLEIPIADGSIKLTGRIDRADMLKTEKGEFIRVIDYKSGNKTFNLSEVYHGLNLQLSVYLLAICRERGASPAGILYFKIDDPLLDSSPEDSSEDINEKRIKALKMTGMLLNDDTVINAMDNESDSSSKLFPVKMSRGKQNGDFATLEQFNVLFGHIKSCVNNIIYSMKQGDISIDPVSINSSYSPCSYCDYKDACLSMGECRALPVVPDDIVWDVFGGSGDFQPLTDSQNRNGKADSSGKGETQE
ncbi:MAG: PD-(D/E)XK nuclease family protein, partial [Bacillota bacterium]|nr:PD-(D/E)XK nuclease family protein [Bacillota bacterium]